MDNLYWYMEYAKVFLAYLFLMFVYPSVLFHSYLKGKGRSFWFGFCICSMIVLLSTIILLLGLVNLLNVWVVRLLFYGSFAIAVYKSVRLPMTPRYFVYKVTNRTYSLKLIRLQITEAVKRAVFRVLKAGWKYVKRDIIEVIALALLMIYALIYFSYGSLTEHYYGFGDMYVHHSWIYGMIQGQSFSAGIYPEGMHCVAYGIYALFGIRVYSVLLFLQCVHNLAFLLSAYLLLRELFPWKYSGLLMLAGFLTMKLECVNEVYGMSRLQWTIPQEFGTFTAFLIPLFLVRYLKNARCVNFKRKKTKLYWSNDLVIFFLAICASFAVHFYATIMAIFSCLGVALIWAGKLLNWRRFVPLAVSAVLAILVAFLPMGLALAEGIPFQGSIFWAMNVINGNYDESVSQIELFESSQAAQGNSEMQTETGIQIQQENVTAIKVPVGQKLQRYWKSFTDLLRKAAQVVFSNGYNTLYRAEWGRIFVIFNILPFVILTVYRIIAVILKKLFGIKKVKSVLFDGYAMLGMIAFIYMVLYVGPAVGIPSVIAGSRLCAVEHMCLIALLAIPADLIGTVLSTFCNTWVQQSTGLMGIFAVFFAVVNTGNYHGYLYFEGSRYTAAVEVTNSIIDNFADNQFTVLSTTDELYQIIEHGYHEEYLTFLEMYRQEEYYIPTKYLFFYVEKHPLQYGQSHFSSGPEWLALERYDSFYFGIASRCPEVLHGEISDDKADREIVTGTKLSNGYTILYNRETVESAIARYMRTLLAQYPNEITVYYEDDDFICYCVEQNPDRLFNLHYDVPEVVS